MNRPLHRVGRVTASRAGFTLVEMLSAMAIIGILASIAIPRMRGPVAKADAASVFGDFVTVRQAAYDFLEDNGRFPRSGGLGVVPAEMQGDVPEFRYKGMNYYWLSVDMRGARSSFYGGKALAIFVVYFNGNTDVAEALRDRPVGWAGTRLRDYYWSPNSAMFVMVE